MDVTLRLAQQSTLDHHRIQAITSVSEEDPITTHHLASSLETYLCTSLPATTGKGLNTGEIWQLGHNSQEAAQEVLALRSSSSFS